MNRSLRKLLDEAAYMARKFEEKKTRRITTQVGASRVVTIPSPKRNSKVVRRAEQPSLPNRREAREPKVRGPPEIPVYDALSVRRLDTSELEEVDVVEQEAAVPLPRRENPKLKQLIEATQYFLSKAERSRMVHEESNKSRLQNAKRKESFQHEDTAPVAKRAAPDYPFDLSVDDDDTVSSDIDM